MLKFILAFIGVFNCIHACVDLETGTYTVDKTGWVCVDLPIPGR